MYKSSSSQKYAHFQKVCKNYKFLKIKNYISEKVGQRAKTLLKDIFHETRYITRNKRQ